MRYLLMLGFLLLIAGMAAAETTDSETVFVFSPTGFHYYPEQYVARMDPIRTELGYQITWTSCPLHTESQGTLPAEFFNGILGSGVGIFVETAEHGYGHPNGTLIACYDDEDIRDDDLDEMNSSNIPLYMSYYDEFFWGILEGWPTMQANFENNGTIVVYDNCGSLGMINKGFDSHSVGLGYSGDVGYHAAWEDAELFWPAFAELMKLEDALGVPNVDLEKTSSSNGEFLLTNYLAAEFDGACLLDGILSFDAVPINTDRFILMAGEGPDGPFTEFAVVFPDDARTHFEYELPSDASWGRVCEVEKDGDFLIHATLRNREKVESPQLRQRPDMDELNERSRGNDSALTGPTKMVSTRGDDRVLLTVTTEAWRDSVWDNVNLYWQNQHGYETYIETVDDYPVPEQDTRDAFRHHLRDVVIKSYYDAAITEGKTLVVHLVGGKNDWEFWSDPNQWPQEFQEKYATYMEYGYPAEGYPERDVIPGWLYPDNDNGYWVPWVL